MAGQDPFDPLGPERDAAAARLDVTALTNFLAGGADNVGDGVGVQLVETPCGFLFRLSCSTLPQYGCSHSQAMSDVILMGKYARLLRYFASTQARTNGINFVR
jgi:hypothetical protein